MNQTRHYSLKQVAEIIAVKPHRISYAISNGFLPEPAERITNCRMFTAADVAAAQEYFLKQDKGGTSTKGGT
jgi:DNA-binding transcriptional MerR regulator